IMFSRFKHGHWTAPEVAPFSGKWNDLEPAASPDGWFLVFASNRPQADNGSAIDGHFNNRTFPGAGGNLWRVDRVRCAWSAPSRLPNTINGDDATFSPSISSDGSLYFMHPDPKTGNFRLYRSQWKGGAYTASLAMPIGDQTTEEVDPAVAPDESFLIYSAKH